MADRLDLLFIGGGRMGEALLAGLLATGAPADSMAVVEPLAARRHELSDKYGVSTSAELRDSSGVILAVKPHLAAVVSAEMARSNPTECWSVAAGVTLGPSMPCFRTLRW